MYDKEKLLSFLVEKKVIKEPTKITSLEIITQHASNRRYWRLNLESGSFIIMEYLQSPFQGEEVGSVSGLKNPYVEVQMIFEKYGLPVPKIYYDFSKDNLLVIEDLGDNLLEYILISKRGEALLCYYYKCIDLIEKLQEIPLESVGDTIIGRRKFDFKLLRWELDHFYEYCVKKLDISLSKGEEEKLNSTFDSIAEEITSFPYIVTHRDFQSRNLILSKGDLYIIDFQDALIGPLVYDLVALLADSYINISSQVQLKGVEYFSKIKNLNKEQVRYMFYLQLIQRKLKDAGRFIFIEREKHNRSFLRYVIPSLNYVRNGIENLPSFEGLKLIYEIIKKVEEKFKENYKEIVG